MRDSLRALFHALRTLARAPAFSLTVLLTLGLTLGLNTAVFSAIDAIVFEPLPFPSADRLMFVTQSRPDTAETNVAPVRIEDWQRLSSTFEVLTGYSISDESDLTGDLPERTRRASVAQRFLDVWRIAPAQGRGFVEAEHRTGGPPAILVSDRYWRTRLGAAPDVLARTVRLGDRGYAIVGVMPASFVFPDPAVDLWLPAAVDGLGAERRDLLWYRGVGRLRPGVTLEQARADLARVQSQLAAEYPATDGTIRPQVEPLKAVIVGSVSASLWLLFGAVTVLLLVTCTNVAALFLARSTRRQNEIAIRQSLGASRGAIVRQIGAEAAVLVLASVGLGALVAGAAPAALAALVPEWPRVADVGLDLRTFTYALFSAVLIAVLCGVLPALRTTRAEASLSMGQRALGGSRGRFLWSLVGVQVALSVVLLAGAGLLLRSSAALSRVDAGFDAERVLAFRLSGDWAETGNPARFAQRVAGNLEALRGVPGVEEAATAIQLPGLRNDFGAAFELPDGGVTPDQTQLAAQVRGVSPSYFGVLGIPLMAGTACRDAGAGSPTSEYMVNRSFAERYFAGRSPVGSSLRFGANIPSGRIMGVVGDVREMGMDRAAVPTAYFCDAAANPFSWFVVRTTGDPSAVAAAVRARLGELEPSRAVYEITPLAEHIGAAYRTNALRTLLLGVFAVAALALACIGLYGTLSYVVSQRHREVGLRMALGANRDRIVAQFVVLALRVVVVATVVGAAVFLASARGLRGMLYGISPWDPLTLVGVVLLMIGIAAIAAALPAWRASRVDPMTVLREE